MAARDDQPMTLIEISAEVERLHFHSLSAYQEATLATIAHAYGTEVSSACVSCGGAGSVGVKYDGVEWESPCPTCTDYTMNRPVEAREDSSGTPKMNRDAQAILMVIIRNALTEARAFGADPLVIDRIDLALGALDVLKSGAPATNVDETDPTAPVGVASAKAVASGTVKYLGRDSCEMVRVIRGPHELPPCGKPRRRKICCDDCFEDLITSGGFTREEADLEYPLLSQAALGTHPSG